ncbi:MAG: hypothetical protein K2J36_04955 [Ruminococcus sp.]|nr:hypothetical protein [Ruminococcus sp.]
MIKYLDGFMKRMEVTACIASIINRRNTSNKIEKLFSNFELDNIIFSVLIHIMERTLTEENDCTIEDVEIFLSEIIMVYGKSRENIDMRELARYIIKDILQNKGNGFTYHVMDYSVNKMKSLNVRLISDKINEHNELVYVLTSQGYDLLLRTKEVDDILGFQMEEIRLHLLISRGIYDEALKQSRNLIKMLNEKQNEIFFFEQSLRRDIHSVSGEEYDTITRSINNMLNEEYEIMKKIEHTIKLAQKSFEEEVKQGKNIGKDEKARDTVNIISRNVDTVLNKQRLLLTSREKLGSLYSETLRTAITTRRERYFDIEDVILKKLENFSENNNLNIEEICAELLNPLVLPKMPDILDIGLFYEPQQHYENEEKTVEESDEELKSDYDEKIRTENRNNAHIEIIRMILEFARLKKLFTLSEFWHECIENNNVKFFTQEKLIFIVMLRLYKEGCIDIENWKRETNISESSGGEFDLPYVLERIYNQNRNMYNIRFIEIIKGNSKINLKWTDEEDGIKYSHDVETDELIFNAEVY